MLQLLNMILCRCSSEDYVLYMRRKVPYLLAHQLYKYESTSDELLNAAFTLALGFPISLDDTEVSVDYTFKPGHNVSIFYCFYHMYFIGEFLLSCSKQQ